MRFPLKVVAALSALTTPLSRIESQEVARRKLPKLPRQTLMEMGVSHYLQPRSCPARIGIARVGWRTEQRKRRFKELAYRQRRNRRMAKGN